MQLNLFPHIKNKLEPVKGTLKVGHRKVAFTIFYERRNNSRVSIGKTGIIIRHPAEISPINSHKQTNAFLSWAYQKLIIDERLAQKEPYRDYSHGDQLLVGETTFTIHLFDIEGKEGRAQTVGSDIYVSIPQHLHQEEQKRQISKYVAWGVGKYYLPTVSKKLHAFNEQYFGKEINTIRMKDNSSNWGSCSSKGNINISSRLMFAPEWVIDYVLIHELAHLVEYNHSPQFWRIVADIMPDYQKAVDWLKDNARSYHF